MVDESTQAKQLEEQQKRTSVILWGGHKITSEELSELSELSKRTRKREYCDTRTIALFYFLRK